MRADTLKEMSDTIEKLANDRAALADMLAKIVMRAGRPKVVREVPAELIEEASKLLASQTYAKLPR